MNKQTSVLVSVPGVNCSSELHGGAGFDRQVLVQRSDSHMGWYAESGGSPSGSRKGFMDKTRVISLSDSGLEKTERKSIFQVDTEASRTPDQL